MIANAFASLSRIRCPPGRLLANSCCPDKDLVVIFSRLGGSDRMSLWNSNQGTRIWETDIADDGIVSQVVGIAWSPDGQSIAVAREPPAVSLHSIQDGHISLSLALTIPAETEGHSFHITGVWWFRDERKPKTRTSIPDIFKRKEIIAGSAHSLLKLFPLLDNLQNEAEKLTATDLFAFQGSHTRTNQKSQFPRIIDSWPSLCPDYESASISASSHSVPSSNPDVNETDASNINSILLVTDNTGHLYSYLDGAFPLGVISLTSSLSLLSISKHPLQPLFIGQYSAALHPMLIEIPLLAQRQPRDLAKLSSTARELTWYALLVVKEMQEAWCGSNSNSGAQGLGPKWVEMLESKQKEQYGGKLLKRLLELCITVITEEEPNPILHLTSLLTTGRVSESLLDYLGSGEQMSERGIQKWESTVSEALIKLRDSAEKRIAPALQRLHIVLEEILGWAQLPQYAAFKFSSEEVAACLASARRGIVIVGWLAAMSRKELSRFREFIAWLRYEVNNVNSPNDGSSPRHDILEVNNYLISGLISSSIDGWFVGPIPNFETSNLGIPGGGTTLAQAIDRARDYVNNPIGMGNYCVHQKDLNHLDRNIDALMQDLASRSQRIFHLASGAACRSVVVSYDFLASPPRESFRQSIFREKSTLRENGEFVQDLISLVQTEESNKNAMLLCKLRFGIEASELPSEIGIALLDCFIPEESDERSIIDLLDVDFFDDESVVIIYRFRPGEQHTYIAILQYNHIGYQNLLPDAYVKRASREDLMHDSLELWKSGHLQAVQCPIKRCRALAGCRSGKVSLALNGRPGRRVACVMDGTGTTLESFDLEGDAEDMDIVGDEARPG